MTYHFGPDYPNETYVPHGYPEHMVDLGEVVMNYAGAGPEAAPTLLLIPGAGRHPGPGGGLVLSHADDLAAPPVRALLRVV